MDSEEIEQSTTDYDLMTFIDYVRKIKAHRHTFDEDGKLRCWYNGVTKEKMSKWEHDYLNSEFRPWDDCKKGYLNLGKRRPQR